MKKKKRLLCAAAGVLLLMGAVSGCGSKPTAESVLKDASENSKKVKSIEGTYSADLGIKAEQSGVSFTMDMKIGGNMQFITEPALMHMDGELSMEQMGVAAKYDIYMDQSDDNAVMYVKMGDQWAKTETEITEEKNNQIDPKELFDELPELEEKTVKEDDRELYVLKGEVQGKKLNELLKKQLDSQDEQVKEMFDKIDFNKSDIPLTLKVDKETMLPASYEMDLVGLMDAVLSGMPEDETVDMSVENFKLNMTFDKYDKLDKIEIPKEALEAQSMDEAALAGNALGESTGQSVY